MVAGKEALWRHSGWAMVAAETGATGHSGARQRGPCYLCALWQCSGLFFNHCSEPASIVCGIAR